MRQPTRRQIALAQLLADGLTMREAAERLGIAHNTARTHAESFRRRAGATSMPHAVAVGFREGWLS
jgi:LuxR family transcriptional activator of conjugal transfer of Ti plasmids